LIDAFSLQLFAVLIPIVGLGAFLWWVGRDMIQGTVRILAAAFIENIWFFISPFMGCINHLYLFTKIVTQDCYFIVFL
jgi:hypothetical protein